MAAPYTSYLHVFQVKSRLEDEYGADGSARLQELEEWATSERLQKNAARLELKHKEKELGKKLAKSQQLAKDRLKKMSAYEEKISELKQETEEFKEMGKAYEAAQEKLASVPDFRPARGAGNGRGGAMFPSHFRRLVWGQCARRTPPTAVPGNVVEAIKAAAPWAQVRDGVWGGGERRLLLLLLLMTSTPLIPLIHRWWRRLQTSCASAAAKSPSLASSVRHGALRTRRRSCLWGGMSRPSSRRA